MDAEENGEETVVNRIYFILPKKGVYPTPVIDQL